MGARDVIGHIDCPVCGHEMPIKTDKNDKAYGHCAHRCNAQVFTRNDHRDSLLRQKMRPVTVTVTDGNGPAPAPAAVAAPATPVQTPAAPVPAPAPASRPAAPPAPSGGWWAPLMGAK